MQPPKSNPSEFFSGCVSQILINIYNLYNNYNAHLVYIKPLGLSISIYFKISLTSRKLWDIHSALFNFLSLIYWLRIYESLCLQGRNGNVSLVTKCL